MNPQIPIYISIAFLIALCFPVYMIAGLASKYSKPNSSAIVFYGIIMFYSIYLLAVGIACFKGAFLEDTLPPKIVQFTTLPLLLFLMGFIFNTTYYKKLLKSIPVYELILLHRFRLIGSFFIILLFLQLLPSTFALIAGIGDVVTALSSWWVVSIMQKYPSHAKKIALCWNTFGFLDILITSSTAMFLTKISLETGTLGVDVLTTFPFCFIPAFAPATIIFLHISIFKKLLVKKFQ